LGVSLTAYRIDLRTFSFSCLDRQGRDSNTTGFMIALYCGVIFSKQIFLIILPFFIRFYRLIPASLREVRDFFSWRVFVSRGEM
jgi:hypothetical protein